MEEEEVAAKRNDEQDQDRDRQDHQHGGQDHRKKILFADGVLILGFFSSAASFRSFW